MPRGIRSPGAWVGTGDPETWSDKTLYAPGMLGARFTIKQPVSAAAGAEEGRDKTYQIVQGDSSMTVTPFKGAVMWWQDRANYKVTTSATNRNQVAGVCQGSFPAGDFFCVQTEGPATVKYVDAPTSPPAATGTTVIPSATAGKADNLAVGTAPTHTIIGRAVSVADGNAEGIVELNVPEMP